MMKKYLLYNLLLIITILSSIVFAQKSMYITEGQKQTSVSIRILTNSEIPHPVEGEQVNITYTMEPQFETIDTNDTYVVWSYYVSPLGEVRRPGYSSFPKGSYFKRSKYYAKDTYIFDTPGVWEIKYVVATDNDLKSMMNTSEWYMFSERVNVLSFYEANSIRSESKSLKISLLGALVPLAAFILGLIGNFLIEKYRYGSKIKVKCYHSVVGGGPGDPIHTVTFEAINYGRVPVTIASIGIEIPKTKEVLHIIRSEIVPFHLPCEVGAGKKFSVIKKFEVLENSLKDKYIGRAFFKDETDQTYYSKSLKKFFENEADKKNYWKSFKELFCGKS